MPRALRLTTPEKVARGVVKAIETDAPEVVVYPGHIRPTLALGLLAPRIAERLNERVGLGPDDRVLALSSLTFDLSVWDLFGTLAAGGVVVVPE